MRSAALAEDAAFVREHGRLPQATQGMRLGVSPARPEKAISRASHAEYDREAI